MTRAGASGVASGHDENVVAAPAAAKWLHLAAAPTFAVMALLTVAVDSGPSNVLCAAGSLHLGGMAPMYLLMAIFHLSPWLRLVSRRRSVVHRA